MLLSDLSKMIVVHDVFNFIDVPISGVTADSRLVLPGWLYVAEVGIQSDGHDYVADAQKRGAAALLVEHAVDSTLPQIIVNTSRPLTGSIAAACHGFPSHKLRVIGVTGTKGKTSTTLILHHLLSSLGYPVSYLGSLGGRVASKELPATLTTRPAAELQELLRDAVDAGESHMVMEVGSHSIVQRRIAGVVFDTAIFTNLAHEHLDYHKSMAEYFSAKALLFSWLGNSGWSADSIKSRKLAIINYDDCYFEELQKQIAVPILSYGLNPKADLWADDLRLEATRTRFNLHWRHQVLKAEVPLVGRNMVVNSLAALAGGIAENLSLEEMLTALQSVPMIPGRFERLDFGQPYTIVVDYAHTEDSLHQAMLTSREMTSGKLIVLFGCTGDRDKLKRPIMGALAVKTADRVFITSDDPHSEDPEAIIAEITDGIPKEYKNWSCQTDRRIAIEEALSEAKEGDFVLLAGKGHEQVQIFADFVLPYSDHQAVADILSRKT